MGLDLLEFTLAVEETFQIAIPDDDAQQILTPRQLVDYVLARSGEAQDCVCLEQRAFYRLRRAAMRLFKVSRERVSPQTPWRELLPQRELRRSWRLLHEATGTPQWPRLTLWGNIRQEVATVGGTAAHLAVYAPVALRAAVGLSRAEVERTVARLMGDQFGIKAFGWEQEFVRDLQLQ
jgi:hypothetical protein